jgi:MFS family permease
VQHVLSALSVVPIVVAFGVGAGWLTIAWWTLLALPARRALLVVFVPPAVALARRGEWRDEPHDPQQRRIVACVLGLAMAAVLTGLATAVLLSPSGRWAIAAGLAIGCGLAHAAYALVRRWTPPPGEREQATVA